MNHGCILRKVFSSMNQKPRDIQFLLFFEDVDSDMVESYVEQVDNFNHYANVRFNTSVSEQSHVSRPLQPLLGLSRLCPKTWVIEA